MPAGQKLTKRLVESLRPAVSGDVFIWDTEVTGFGVRVKPSGTRSFMFRYRTPGGGNDRKVTIGRYPSLSVEEAREHARELYAQKSKGVDPAVERRRARAAKTVRELADYYLGQHATTKGNRTTTLNEYRRALGKHLLPKFGNWKLNQFTKGDMTALMHTLVGTPTAANRLRAVISGMYGVAVNLGWIEKNPCQGVIAYRERARERFLTTAEQSALVTYLNRHRNQNAADVVRLLLLTGARRGEVLAATWNMFDLTRKLWIKPSHHTKQNREHVVGLSKAAVEILESRQEKVGAASIFVFPRRSDPAKPIVGIKKFWAALQKDLGLEGVRLHDLRHTSASVLLSAGHSLAEVGGVLGHTQSRTTERYAHLFDENIHRSAATLDEAFFKMVRDTKS
ncbi:site-specific integrase [Rhodanobacter sp. C05]|uniref:tyrosine-type recombinase/integrase n=1 Tax=Rhodanobacter sp. C05 TaxID=1945855 RepID=UPI0009863A2C|nr:site-specific integrase [Rhodanobacter sp. C05]OOG42696.1 hypothetical protein B0E51_04415 [Rhodanobacter sp. C05]